MQHTQKQTLATKSRNQTDRQPASHLGFLTPSMPWTCLSPWLRRRPVRWQYSHLSAPSAQAVAVYKPPPPQTLPSQLPPGALRIQGGPVLPPAHEGWGSAVHPAGQHGHLVHGGVHCGRSWLDGGHHWGGGGRGTERVGAGSLRPSGGSARGGVRPTHCGSPRGRPRWCCPRRCGPCSCSCPRRPCSGPAAGGTFPVLGTGCGRPPTGSPGWRDPP